VRLPRIEPPSGVPARLGSFAVVLVLAAGGGWAAGHSVGPVRLPAPTHQHGEVGGAPGEVTE
jgi:hypothetical protein